MKYIVFSDIHFGNHSNSDVFNQQCLDFLDFVNDYAQDHFSDDETYGGAIFMGDWFHNRNTINVKTLNAGVEGLYTLSNIACGKNAYFLLGNHDLFYKDRRDIHSIIVPGSDLGIEVINEPIYLDKEKFLLCPWLIGDETLRELITEYNPNYAFGHFELPSFKLNQKVAMDGVFDPNDYKGPKRILSGHFHTRNGKNNIEYIGNCFSNDFSDSNDWHNKGFCVLDTDVNELEYHEWIDAPKYCATKISQMNKIEFGSNMVLKLIDDVGLKPLELNQMKEELEKMEQINEVYIIPQQLDEELVMEENTELDNISDINTLITSLLSNLDMEKIDNNKLINIYNQL